MMPPLLVCVPFRAGPGKAHRAAHLEAFLDHVPAFLDAANIDYLVIVAAQAHTHKFNRGKCLNAAFDWAHRNHPSHAGRAVCFHDVDLLPVPGPALAAAYARIDVHLARCWRRYDTDTYLGGALVLSAPTFIKVNGFPNQYWGWGGEDDELAERLYHHNVAIERFVDGAYVDLEDMDLAAKLTHLRSDPALKCLDKWEVRAGYRARRSAGLAVEGLADVRYDGVATQLGPRVVRLDVDLSMGD